MACRRFVKSDTLKLRRYNLRKQFTVFLAALVLIVATLPVLIWPQPSRAAGASLKFSPNQGEYFINSTFEVSIVLDTGGQAINAVEINVTFPPDKLQVVSPSVGKSFIDIWTAPPSFSNTDGTLSFQGGLPSPGINTSSGVISTIEFRAKSSGKAVMKFASDSKVLANDGTGQNILTSVSQSIHTYTLKLAPPEGPIVSSPTHGDQNKWFNIRTAALQWERNVEVVGYSYSFDNTATTIPEEKISTKETQVSQTATTDGIWYFHIRAQNREDGWGGVTHFILRIDTTPPAAFKPQLSKTAFPTDSRPVVTFVTTDAASGIDHYEVKVINKNQTSDAVTLFTEQSSPYQLPQLAEGEYSVVVKAYDNAGNSIDGTTDVIIGGVAATLTAIPIFANPLINNIVIGLLGLLLVVMLALWWRRYRQAHSVGSIRADLEFLKKTVTNKQSELKSLVNLEQKATGELQTLERTAAPSVSQAKTAIFDPISAQSQQPGQPVAGDQLQSRPTASGNERNLSEQAQSAENLDGVPTADNPR